jgi:L,D-transpeptidase YcbB
VGKFARAIFVAKLRQSVARASFSAVKAISCVYYSVQLIKALKACRWVRAHFSLSLDAIVKNFSPASGRGLGGALGASALALVLSFSAPANAQTSAFNQAVAEAGAVSDAVAEFYSGRNYVPLWTGSEDIDRRHALIVVLSEAQDQGLPVTRYDLAGLVRASQNAITEGDRGRLEVAMSQAYLAYARDVKSGVLEPVKVDAGIVREIIRPDPAILLRDIATTTAPEAYLRNLAPHAPEYARLVKEKLRLELLGSQPSLSFVSTGRLGPGDRGGDVVALRDRLVAYGYMGRSSTAVYDRQIQTAVQRFQLDQGLTADGVAGESTISMLNMTQEQRLEAVVVALERLRWMGDAPRGSRHIWVNQPDFTAKVVDDGEVVFKTRVVIGKNQPDRRSPEFSDQMEYLVVNPSWGVPRSIIVKEYLPLLQRNPNAVSHLQVVDSRGRVINRGAVDFAAYSARSFPYGLRQPPSERNALGVVKFMFPNPYNIYLHDTPDKGLFSKEMRAYSHGCIRLGDPIDFAYTLLGRQSDDPKGLFAEKLATRKESNITLEQAIPVHLVYFTAWPAADGEMSYRQDVYGRDKLLFDALTKAGVALPSVQG